MKSYGVVKNTYQQQQFTYYNVKLQEKINPIIQMDKIKHPSPQPGPPHHVVQRFVQQKPYHIIQRYPRNRASLQQDIFDKIIASNIIVSQKNKQLINQQTNTGSRKAQSVERHTRKPIFNKKNQDETTQKLPKKEPNDKFHNSKSQIKQLDRSSNNQSPMIGNKRSIFSLQNKLYHDMMLPAYERITQQLQQKERHEHKLLQRSKERQMENISIVKSEMKQSLRQKQRQRSETSKNITNKSQKSQKSHTDSKNSRQNIQTNKHIQKEMKIIQLERSKLQITSNVTNLQIINKFQQVKSLEQSVKKQVQKSKQQGPKQIQQRKPKQRNTKKKQAIYPDNPDNSINIEYPHSILNSQNNPPINIKINITIGNPSKRSQIQNNNNQQLEYSRVQSIYSEKIAQKSISSILNEEESKKRQLESKKSASIYSNFDKMGFKKLKINSEQSSLNEPQAPSILKLKPKGLKLSSEPSKKDSLQSSFIQSQISFSVYAIKGIDPIII